MAEPGPSDPSLLYLQSQHRSSLIWTTPDIRSLDCVRGDPGDWRSNVPGRVVQLIQSAGLYGVFRLHMKRLDHALITALVERWRQETHTFHLPTGEMTVTLQDVAVLFGLPVNGRAVIGLEDTRSIFSWQALCHELLGQTPPESAIKSAGLKLTWLRTTFAVVPNNADEQVMQYYARAYCLLLIGTMLLVDKSQNAVKLVYLPLLRDLTGSDPYSWGSATLAILYRELCKASQRETRDIAGPLFLLQFWAWERLPSLRRMCVPTTDDVFGTLQIGDFRFPGAPRGCRWNVKFIMDSVPTHVLVVYRDQLDRLRDDEVIWMPYPANVLADLPEYCRDGQDIWMALVPLICYEIVEYHYPERVLRQFGYRQGIPQHCDTGRALHKITRRGKFGADWTEEHALHIQMWNRRRPADLSDVQVGLGVDDQYMPWYRQVTRRFVVNPSYRPQFGYLATGQRPTLQDDDISHMLRQVEYALRSKDHAVRDEVLREVRDTCSRALYLHSQCEMPTHVSPSPQRIPDPIVEADPPQFDPEPGVALHEDTDRLIKNPKIKTITKIDSNSKRVKKE